MYSVATCCDSFASFEWASTGSPPGLMIQDTTEQSITGATPAIRLVRCIFGFLTSRQVDSFRSDIYTASSAPDVSRARG